ncbi:glycosyltransferase family 4 protein [Pseudalkalibacillus sp. A8]|uniref:glycosyltransferase family 4 protein n=1 Tax=Pseudalkalibacillus sp. A8 TaxID=3382641 RepID=UPI0038B49B8A
MKNTSQTIRTTRIGFWSPYLHSKRGNSTTARRIVTGLRQTGFSVEVYAYEEDEWTPQIQTRMDSCDLFHILHFDRFAKWMQKKNVELTKPYIVTSGGTDVNEKMENPISKDLLLNASAITVFTDDAKDKVTGAYPQLDGRVEVVPQSFWLPEDGDFNDIDLHEGYPKMLLPSGVRKVKDVLYVMDEIESLTKEYPELRFVIAGEPLEKEEVEHVKVYEDKNSWFTYVGSLPLASMTSVYKWADMVLNTSVSEGQPLSLMEAMYYGKPVIARRNGGNESLITDGSNGFLFTDPPQFKRQLLKLMNSKELYAQMAEKGRERIANDFSLKKEIQHYQGIYQSIRGDHL